MITGRISNPDGHIIAIYLMRHLPLRSCAFNVYEVCLMLSKQIMVSLMLAVSCHFAVVNDLASANR